jgi:integrase
MKRPFTLHKRGKVWYYKLAGEATAHSTGKPTRAAAERFCQEAVARVKPAETMLREFTKDFFIYGRCTWIKKQLAHGQSFGRLNARNRRGHLDNHILKAFGDAKLYELTKKGIEDWLAGLELSNQSRNHILYTLRIVLREARDARLITENPLQEPDTFGKQFTPRDVFSAAELRLLFPVGPKELRHIWASDDIAVMFLVLASTGIRSGEVRALQWKHVLWEERALLVERAVKGDGEGSIEFGPISELKGGARIVLLPARTLEALRDWQGKAFYAKPDDLVFQGSARTMPVMVSMSRRVADAIRRVNKPAIDKGLPALIEVGARNLVAHSFRHTYNTMMRRQVPEGVLHELTGHSSSAMTDRYDHPEIAERIKALLPARLAVEGLLSG